MQFRNVVFNEIKLLAIRRLAGGSGQLVMPELVEMLLLLAIGQIIIEIRILEGATIFRVPPCLLAPLAAGSNLSNGPLEYVLHERLPASFLVRGAARSWRVAVNSTVGCSAACRDGRRRTLLLGRVSAPMFHVKLFTVLNQIWPIEDRRWSSVSNDGKSHGQSSHTNRSSYL